MCPLHHQYIYQKLRKMSTTGNNMNWQLFGELSLRLALQGTRYWDNQFDHYFLQQAKTNEDLLLQQQTAQKIIDAK